MSVAYDDVTEEGLKAFRELSATEAMKMLRELDKSLSRYDREANPAVTGEGRYRTGLGLYLIEENLDEDKT